MRLRCSFLFVMRRSDQGNEEICRSLATYECSDTEYRRMYLFTLEIYNGQSSKFHPAPPVQADTEQGRSGFSYTIYRRRSSGDPSLSLQDWCISSSLLALPEERDRQGLCWSHSDQDPVTARVAILVIVTLSLG